MSLDQLLSWVPAGSAEAELARQIHFDRLPRHVAVIMDGNGRWAGERHLPRVEGHRAGIDAVRDVIETSARLGLDVLTLYAFSTENWKRPITEVSTLMMLLKRYLRSELSTLLQEQHPLQRHRPVARARAGHPRRSCAPRSGRRRRNTGMLFNIALNYSGRTEIVEAARRAIEAGIPPEALDEQKFSELLYTGGQPDPDLLIRTSGEMRVSNFLLWQIAYAEIWVTDTYWPDFRCRHLLEAILAYQKRDRRYGGIAVGAGGRRRALGAFASMTRVLSGVVLGAAFFTIVWFGTTVVLLGVAMAVCALAFREYADLMAEAARRSRRG